MMFSLDLAHEAAKPQAQHRKHTKVHQCRGCQRRCHGASAQQFVLAQCQPIDALRHDLHEATHHRAGYRHAHRKASPARQGLLTAAPMQTPQQQGLIGIGGQADGQGQRR